ncbi:MAG: hypothetical protein WDA17_05990 [Sphaerochaetaceae bacterium]|jgi:hypothetical protein
MTRKYVAIFVAITVLFFSIFETFFGFKGYLVNIEHQKRLQESKQVLVNGKLELSKSESLLKQSDSKENILGNVQILGYGQRGQTIYYFLNEEGSLDSKPDENKVMGAAINTDIQIQKSFRGFSKIVNLLFSLVISVPITLISLIISKRKNDDTENFRDNNVQNFR